MSKALASIALRRFGLGPRPGDVKRVAADPRGYVLAALESRESARITGGELTTSHDAFRRIRTIARAQRQARMATDDRARESLRAGGSEGAGGMQPGSMPGDRAAPSEAAKVDAVTARRALRRDILLAEWSARLDRGVTTDSPFLERLVLFWSNHFCVSARKGAAVRVMCGAYEREAIRPYVLGRFADMLRAVEQHPAMLIYLDNVQSMGPNSRAGARRGKGLNENLAREILELHTLGVDGGYTQADVTNLARLITGWSVGGLTQRRVEPGRFTFLRQRHEPGSFTLMGRRYDQSGVASGEAALADLARHPATARHIAVKLARHFVSDRPHPDLVERLRRTFLDTDGNLAAIARALATAPEAWQAPASKIVPPYDYLVQLMRGFSVQLRPERVMRLAAALGQPTWAPPSPKGWPDGDDAWMGPAAIRERLRVAELFARRAAGRMDARQAAQDLLDAGSAAQTLEAIGRAETHSQGLQLLAMSPQFLRR